MTSSDSPTSVSVICEEVFEEGYQPLADEINDYAVKIGIDPEKEPELLYLAKEGLMQAVPSDWKVCYNDKIHATYYYNRRTQVTQWEHPLDVIYRNLVDETRKKLQSKSSIQDTSEDISQVDSGIRSLQGNESSEVNSNDKPIIVSFKKSLASSSFLEMKGRKPTGLEPIRTSRFEVVKTNPQISLDMLTNANSGTTTDSNPRTKTDDEQILLAKQDLKKGFTISGTGAMFLKSTTKKSDDYSSKNYFTETFSSNVKGILRDSSLTDVRKRFGDEAADSEDKKSVRFNLDAIKLRANYSPEDDPSSSRKFGPSPDASDNSDGGDDDDPWDFMEEDDHEEEAAKHVKEITVTPVAKPPPPPLKAFKPFLKPQLSSDELLPKPKLKLTSLGRTFSADGNSAERPKMSLLETRRISEQKPVKPLYEDTDSESKESSVRSFLQKPVETELVDNIESYNRNMEAVRKDHEQQLESLRARLKAERDQEEKRLRDDIQKSLAEKRKNFQQIQEDGVFRSDLEKTRRELRKIAETTIDEDKSQIDNEMREAVKRYREEKELQHKELLEIEDMNLDRSFQQDFENMKQMYAEKLEIVRSEYEAKLEDIKRTLEEEQIHKLEEYRIAIQEEFHSKRQQILAEHKATVDVLQKNHAEIVHELERDLKSEGEILKREHQKNLSGMRDKLELELDAERQKMRENGEDRLYEKIRCEKRLLEDKYRCLKEKYIRLKTDVRITLERRQKRREQQAQQASITTTGSVTETDRSLSNKPSIGNSENRSASLSLPNSEQTKPAIPPKNHLSIKQHIREKSAERAQARERKLTMPSKYLKQFQNPAYDDTTSISQSDTTISNNYPKGKYLPSPFSDNGNSDSEAFYRNRENNNVARDRQRKKLFTRMKSASTSRLNSENFKPDRPCTPVENLRRQLQKLEDLEDQFPDNTLDATYHLRYPFSDISNDHVVGSSSELEFFKHRIQIERDSVRRAKESLRTQRANFRTRQREIKQHHKIGNARHSLDQLISEERDLTEMEVSLHRTRALLGEKVIRLRHLEQSLQRIYEKESPIEYLHIENKDDATTLSDLSSHSSSGFSSTDFASETINRRKDLFQEPTECIQNLEILNAEIREFLDILGSRPANGLPSSPQMLPPEMNWSILAQNIQQPNNTMTTTLLQHTPHSIPTLADRLETYRQLAAGRVQNSVGNALLAANTIVSQSPRAVNYTTSLVERTRDLRNWLRQAKNEHDILSSAGVVNIGSGFGTNMTATSVTTTGQQANI